MSEVKSILISERLKRARSAIGISKFVDGLLAEGQ
jgi:hypothetical protein